MIKLRTKLETYESNFVNVGDRQDEGGSGNIYNEAVLKTLQKNQEDISKLITETLKNIKISP